MRSTPWSATFLALLLAACGGGGGGGDTPTRQAEGPHASNLSVMASVPETLPAGAPTVIRVTLANSGPGTALAPRLTADLGAGLAFTGFACTSAQGTSCPAPRSPGLPDLPAGGSLTFELAVVLEGTARGPIATTLLASASNDLSESDNGAQAVVSAWQADVLVTGTAPALPVPAGTQALYTMVVANAGPDDARDVRIVNTLGPGQALGAMTCSAAGGAACPAASAAEMRLPRLPAHGSLTFTVPAGVAAGTSGSIANSMRVEAAGDPLASNNTATAHAAAYTIDVPGQTRITLQSDLGDHIGQARTHAYTRDAALLNVTADAGRLQVNVAGDEDWSGVFVLPAGMDRFVPGTYANLGRWPAQDAPAGGMDWSGEGRQCGSLRGAFTVLGATYAGAQLAAIDLEFEQHCEGMGPALRGRVTWFASDATTPAGPASPAPSSLWAPAPGATPASGSYVHLQSDAADHVGAGRTVTYTRADALLAVTLTGQQLTVTVAGDASWRGDLAGIATLAQLRPGYYGQLQRTGSHNPARGGLDFSGEGRGCERLAGWFVVDAISFSNGSLATLDLRFAQHCDAGAAALRGKVHWDASDAAAAPLPQAIPAGLWAPAPDAVPAGGNFIHLESDAADWIGQGATTTLASADTAISLWSRGGTMTIAAAGWRGSFRAMHGLAALQPGYYADLGIYPAHNPVRGGLSWAGHGRGCNRLQGWFVVDAVRYDGDQLAMVDLRFGQHCEGNAAALRGRIRWQR